MNLKERIADLETKFKAELSLLSHYNHHIESAPQIFKSITELQEIIEIQNEALLDVSMEFIPDPVGKKIKQVLEKIKEKMEK